MDILAPGFGCESMISFRLHQQKVDKESTVDYPEMS
jgi:hypothetical protein